MKQRIKPARAWGVLSLIAIALLTLAALGFVFAFEDDKKAALLLAVIICLPVALVALWLAFAQTQSTIVVTDTELLFRVPIYGKRFALSEIDATAMQNVNLSTARELRLFLRSNGVGIPGYQLGWFILRDKRKVLAAVTHKEVLIIPTHRGYSLVASVVDGEALAEEIRRRVDALEAA